MCYVSQCDSFVPKKTSLTTSESLKFLHTTDVYVPLWPCFQVLLPRSLHGLTSNLPLVSSF